MFCFPVPLGLTGKNMRVVNAEIALLPHSGLKTRLEAKTGAPQVLAQPSNFLCISYTSHLHTSRPFLRMPVPPVVHCQHIGL